MSLVTLTNPAFNAGTTAIGSQVIADFNNIVNVVNGNIDTTNFGTLAGAVIWSVTTNVLAQSISSSSTAGLVSMSSTGILAGGNSIVSISSNANQTTGQAGFYASFTSASSTIPVVLVNNAGTGPSISVTNNGVLAASQAALSVTSTGAQTTGQAGLYASFTSASSTIPVVATNNAGTGPSFSIVNNGVLAASQSIVSITSTGAQTTGQAGLFVQFTNASSTIPAIQVKNAGTGDLLNLQDNSGNVRFKVDSLGNVTGTSFTQVDNALLNSDFGLWQRGTSLTVTNGTSTYVPDRWYGKNSLGTNGVLTLLQVAAVTNGSQFGSKLQITVAPTAAQANGCELYYTLENKDSLQFYGQTASFTVLVKSFGNVNQVGIQFFYKTTEAKVDTAIGSEVLTTVNTSTFTACTINGQALGTSQTTSGVVGVRIRITGVSSGNTYDLNNGFVIEQPQMNLGPYAAAWRRAHRSVVDEIHACQRYYEKTYDFSVSATTVTNVGMGIVCPGVGTTLPTSVSFKVPKRITNCIVSIYSPNTGTGLRIYDATAAADFANNATGTNIGMSGFSLTTALATTDAHVYEYHWTADAEI